MFWPLTLRSDAFHYLSYCDCIVCCKNCFSSFGVALSMLFTKSVLALYTWLGHWWAIGDVRPNMKDGLVFRCFNVFGLGLWFNFFTWSVFAFIVLSSGLSISSGVYTGTISSYRFPSIPSSDSFDTLAGEVPLSMFYYDYNLRYLL